MTRMLLTLALLAILNGPGCAVLTIEVDVYKGPLTQKDMRAVAGSAVLDIEHIAKGIIETDDILNGVVGADALDSSLPVHAQNTLEGLVELAKGVASTLEDGKADWALGGSDTEFFNFKVLGQQCVDVAAVVREHHNASKLAAEEYHRISIDRPPNPDWGEGAVRFWKALRSREAMIDLLELNGRTLLTTVDFIKEDFEREDQHDRKTFELRRIEDRLGDVREQIAVERGRNAPNEVLARLFGEQEELEIQKMRIERSQGAGMQGELSQTLERMELDLIKALSEPADEGSEQEKKIKALRKAIQEARVALAYRTKSKPAWAYLQLERLQRYEKWRNELRVRLKRAISINPFDDKTTYDDLEIENQRNWARVNTIRLGGMDSSNYMLVKDDVGNWYVRQFSTDAGQIREAFKAGVGLAIGP